MKQLLIEFPTVTDYVNCNVTTSTRTTKCPIPVPLITLLVTNGVLNSLEEDIKRRLLNENTMCHHFDKEGNECGGTKTIQSIISPMHLLIELNSLNLEGM